MANKKGNAPYKVGRSKVGKPNLKMKTAPKEQMKQDPFGDHFQATRYKKNPCKHSMAKY